MTVQPLIDNPPRSTSAQPLPPTLPAQMPPEPAVEVVSTWPAPPWAATSTHDEECVIHRRGVGEIHGLDRARPLSVELVQRDELQVDEESVLVNRREAYVSLAGEGLTFQAGEGLTFQQAKDLARLLDTASEMIASAEHAA